MNLKTLYCLALLGFINVSVIGCGQSEPEAADDMTSENADEISLAASPATRDALGVVQWRRTAGEVSGYDADGAKVCALLYRTTAAAGTQSILDIRLLERGGISTASVEVSARPDGTAAIALKERNFSDVSTSARTLSFMEQDFSEVARVIGPQSLRPLDGPGVDLTREVSCDLYGPKNPTVIRIASWVTKVDFSRVGQVNSWEVQTCYELVHAACIPKAGGTGACKNGPVDLVPKQ